MEAQDQVATFCVHEKRLRLELHVRSTGSDSLRRQLCKHSIAPTHHKHFLRTYIDEFDGQCPHNRGPQ